jgi:hypothetical protein
VADPSSSEVIHHLSGVLTRFLYVAAALGASGTLIIAFFELFGSHHRPGSIYLGSSGCYISDQPIRPAKNHPQGQMENYE